MPRHYLWLLALAAGLALLGLMLWLGPTRTVTPGPADRGQPARVVTADQPTLAPALTLQTGHSVTAVAFSPDGGTLAVAAGNANAAGSITLWRLPGGQLSLTLAEMDNNPTWSVAFSPAGNGEPTLAAGSQDNQVTLWRPGDGKRLAAWAQPANSTDAKTVTRGVTAVAFSPDGQFLASAGLETIWLWRVADHSLSLTLPGREPEVAFSPDGRLLATRSQAGQIELLAAADGQPVAAFADPLPGMCPLAFSPDGQTLAACQRDGTIKLLRLPGGEVAATLAGHRNGTTRVVFSPDGKTLASAGIDDTSGSGENVQPVSAPRLWNLETGQPAAEFQSSTGLIRALAFSPDGRWLAAGLETVVWLWQLTGSD